MATSSSALTTERGDLAYFLPLGSYDVTGYIDLTPDSRLQVTEPIYPTGAETSVANLLGYETANYIFLREGRENQLQAETS